MKQEMTPYEKFKQLKPEFATTSEYINHLSQQLEVLAKKRSLTIPQLVDAAETSKKQDDELSRALSVSSEISALKASIL